MKKSVPRSGGMTVKTPPDISLEWIDVTIDIKVCGADIPPEDRGFVRLFPVLDQRLLSSDILDARKIRLKEKKKQERPKYREYEYVQRKDPAEKVAPKVLPKLTCTHCGKSFSRKSTLDQHLVTHSSTKNNESWEDVQDAAVKDLECAIAFSSMSGEASLMTISGEINQKSPGGDEEEEIAPPEDIKDEPKEVKTTDVDQHECPKCSKAFSKVSLLNRHMKVHSGVKPFGCTVCGVRFLQKYNLNKHLLIHGKNGTHNL